MQQTNHPSIQPVIFDTTLREGFQTPGGVGASEQERLYIAKLAAPYVDWLEIGMPANAVDRQSMQAICRQHRNDKDPVGIAALVRNRVDDVAQAADAFGDYPKSLVHIFVGTSNEHVANRFSGKKTREEYVFDIERTIRFAANQKFSRVMFSPEDAIRTYVQNPTFFFACIDAAVRGHASSGRNGRIVINLPDTIGMSETNEFVAVMKAVHQRYNANNIPRIDVSIHSHNDSGNAHTHAYEAYASGYASWIQSTFGGIGERNGITSTEGIIARLHERGIISPRGDMSKLVPTTRAILAAMGRDVDAHAIISGDYTNVSASGIHTQIAARDVHTYHVRGPAYGATQRMEFGPTSGSNQVKSIFFERFGREADTTFLEAFVNECKEECNQRKAPLSDSEIISRVISHRIDKNQCFTVDRFAFSMDQNGTHFEFEGIYDAKPFTQKKQNHADLQTVIEALHSVVGDRHPFEFHDFSTRLVPFIGENELTQGIVPTHLGLNSRMCATTTIKGVDGRLYAASHIDAGSMRAIVQSAITVVQDYVMIRTYFEK